MVYYVFLDVKKHFPYIIENTVNTINEDDKLLGIYTDIEEAKQFQEDWWYFSYLQ